jgi:hypothetical protein
MFERVFDLGRLAFIEECVMKEHMMSGAVLYGNLSC